MISLGIGVLTSHAHLVVEMRTTGVLCLSICIINVALTGCGGGSASSGNPPPPQQNPIPSLSSISPGNASTGSSALTIAAAGSNFISGSQIEWDGQPLSTAYGSSTSLQAQIPAGDFAQIGTHSVTVVNPPPGGGSSSAKTFLVNAISGTRVTVLDIQANDLVWDPQNQRIYASMAGTAMTNPDSVVAIDPTTGKVVASQAIGNGPNLLAISNDSQFLYTGLNTSGAIQRFTLPGLTPDISFLLGSDPTSGPYHAIGLAVAPGMPHTTAVVLGQGTVLPMYGAAIYDDAKARPATIPSIPQGGPSIGQIQWGADSSSLCAEGYTDGGGPIFCYSVDSTGVASRNDYAEMGPLAGMHRHFDPVTRYIYADDGTVSDPATGRTLGYYYPNFLPVLGENFLLADSSVNRIFVLGQATSQFVQGADVTDYTIDVFDQTHFTEIGSMIIPGVIGKPMHFILYGNAGLAFSTANVLTNLPEKVYLIDGNIVNNNVPADSTIGTDYGPVPFLSSITPASAIAGAASFTLSLAGQGFTSASSIQLGNATLATTFVSSTQLQAQVPSSALIQPTAATVSVSNPSVTLASSNQLIFTVFPAQSTGTSITPLNLVCEDIAWDPIANKLYAAVSGTDLNSGNSIAIIDPSTLTIQNTIFAGSEPMLIRVSSDSSLAYVGFLGSASVQQYSLPSFAPTMEWNVGNSALFKTPFYPMDLQIAPGAPHTTAVTAGLFIATPFAEGGVSIFDDNIPRPATAPGWEQSSQLYDSLEWGATAGALYSVDYEDTMDAFYTLSVTSSGVSLQQEYDHDLNGVNDFRIHFDSGTGYLYEDNGQIINPANGSIVASLPASGLVVPDSTLNRIFVLGQSSSGLFGIEIFDQTTLAPVGSIDVSNIAGFPWKLIRWGTAGLALITFDPDIPFAGPPYSPGLLYVISSPLVSGPNVAAARSLSAEHVRKRWRTRRFLRRDQQK